MCGIAGYYNFKGNVNRERFEKMIDIIAHRGPDDRGSFYRQGLALGHRRLSIVDLSRDGHQPFFYQNRYVMVFNGEIYNYRELKKELVEKGYQFKSQADTEVLIAAYDCWGKECVQRLNGMWAFAILDQEKEEIYCSRDRYGVKPFYYYIDKTQFIFGSEIKQILYMIDKKPIANKKRLLEFLVCGDLDFTAETMFQGIMQLRGGEELVFDLSTKEIRFNQYYHIGKKKIRSCSYRENCKIFKNAFEKSVKLRMRADVPVGYCLSGGLDSSAIVSVANRLVTDSGQGEQHAVSSCFEDKAYDEQEYIDEVLRGTNIYSHKIYPDGTRLFDEVDKIIWHMDEPFGSTSIYAQWNVFREAKKNGLTVMLDGQGADEQLAGYSPFYGVYFANLLRRFKMITFLRELYNYRKLRASTEKHVNAWGIVLPAFASAYMPRRIHSALSKRYISTMGLPFAPEQLKEVYGNREIYPLGNGRQYIIDSMQYGMQALLHYEDRNSMAFSIESRVPFLDYKLVEAVFEMPFEHKIRKGITKAVMRDGLKDILPEKIRTRYSKLGFVTPEDKWINEHYAEYRAELEKACEALAPLLNPPMVMEWFDKNKGKVARGNFMVWRIICAGRWARLFQVSI